MPYRIAKSITLESGHLLSKHPGACRFPHGHSRTIEVIVTADELDQNDMVCDFQALKAAVLAAVGHYDHAFLLNAEDPQYAALHAAYGDRIIAFAGSDPTTEVLAHTVFHAFSVRLEAARATPDFPVAGNVRVERVRVTETATSWAEYWE